MFVISFLSFLVSPATFERPTPKSVTTCTLGVLCFVVDVCAFCGDTIRWSHTVDMAAVYGRWHGAGRARHAPPLAPSPDHGGCLTLYIEDATLQSHDDWLHWPINRRNYTDQQWRPYGSDPWSETAVSGSGLDGRAKRKARRDLYEERTVRVVWDEDGRSAEHWYRYTREEPGLWAEDATTHPGVDVWHREEPPQHPQVIRILEVGADSLIINYCSERASAGVFSLLLRRQPPATPRAQWYELKKQLYKFELPPIYTYSVMCGGSVETVSLVVALTCAASCLLL